MTTQRFWRGQGAAALAAPCLLILGATFLAYWPVLGAGFVWNDSDYVTAPELQSWRGLGRIWFEVGATQQYYPLLHSAFWLEHRLWGGAAAGYHGVNILLHGLSACLFAAILRRLGQKPLPACLAGLIFALHPVCVESVAWITEQKNTLSTFFYLGSALFYFRFHQRRLPGDYTIAFACFVLALASKSMAATLPGALLVVVWAVEGKLTWRRDIGPLLPWLGVGAGAGLFTAWVERRYLGAEGPAFALSGPERWCLAGRALWFYLGKTCWPTRLIFIYPRWSPEIGSIWDLLPALGALAGLTALWAFRGRSRAPLAAALLFLGALFPVLGFFNVYAFVFSFVADHWQYLALFGVIALGAGGWGRWFGASRSARLPALTLAAGWVVLLGCLTRRDCRTFKDPEGFYRTLLRGNPSAWMAHNNLGNILAASGRPAEAKAEYAEALRLRPDYPEALTNSGLILANEGHVTEAIAHYEEALRVGPDEPRIRNDWGIALARSGRDAQAIEQYRRGLQLNPRSGELHHNLALALLRSGRAGEAAEEYRAVVALTPADPYAHYDLGIALADLPGQADAAKAEWESALRLKPDLPLALLRLGSWYRSAGQLERAIAEDEAALRIDPALAIGHNHLGNTLRQAGRLAAAIPHYETALRLEPRFAEAENNLGSALAALGRLPEALAHLEKAVALSPGSYAAQLNLAEVLQASGRPEQARPHFEAAARLKIAPARSSP